MPGYPHLNLEFGCGIKVRVEAAAPVGRSHGRLYPKLIAARLPEISGIEPNLMLA
jgi:hypothetical protein